MALEPRTLTIDSGNPELADTTRRFWIALALSVPILLVLIAGFIPGLSFLHGNRMVQWAEFALATPVVKLRVRPGESVPVAGIVIDGNSSRTRSFCLVMCWTIR
ncbi:MAG: hypothetical protein M3Y27_10745 [Acidobacteriota bacterium]|nr:hypothetical protein [Acidobacteriota bacterium]